MTGRRIRRYNQGGYLQGPSHEQGGIPAIVAGGEAIELEGGEYIMNAQTVSALGTQFMDMINSTATTYHTGGYDPGQLPSPSQYRKGGVAKSTKKMPVGGPVQGNPMHPGFLNYAKNKLEGAQHGSEGVRRAALMDVRNRGIMHLRGQGMEYTGGNQTYRKGGHAPLKPKSPHIMNPGRPVGKSRVWINRNMGKRFEGGKQICPNGMFMREGVCQ